jgi:hypothetical protein
LNNSEETWQEAQTTLYKQLGEQMRYVFNGNGKAEAKEPPQKKLPVLPKPHWCSEHNQEFKKRNGPHGEFYSHRIKDTRDWCNEKATT